MNIFKRKVAETKTLWEKAELVAEEMYHQILRRADDREPDDEAKIESLLPYLGITWKQAKSDFAVLKRADELTKVIADAKEAEKAVADVTPKLAALNKQLNDYKAQMEPQIAVLQNAKWDAERIRDKQWEATSELNDLRTRFPRAFGVRAADVETVKDEPNPRVLVEKKPEVIGRYGGPPTEPHQP